MSQTAWPEFRSLPIALMVADDSLRPQSDKLLRVRPKVSSTYNTAAKVSEIDLLGRVALFVNTRTV